MITVNVMGGLGNQLFMIFTGLAYGIQYNQKVVFPTHNCMGERGTYWDTFFKDLAIFTTSHPSNISENERASFPKYAEPNYLYQPIPDFQGQNVCLFGYFQSSKYFEQFQSIIKRILHLYDKQKEIRENYASFFFPLGVENEEKEIVSIHFRMGDYKQKPGHHPIMNYEYFEGSLAHIMDRRPNVARVLYFCEAEDNEYVKKQIDMLKAKWPDIEFMKVDDQITDYNQLLIMSCCHHNIISNSSFSWWGAYLNENPDKIVCYPSKWYGISYSHLTTSDLCPDSWTKITSEHVDPKMYL